MSDAEGPPSKLVKIDLAPLAQDETLENQDNGQEEWLSEGVLTDDDYNQSADQDGTISQFGNTSQDDSQPSIPDHTVDNGDHSLDESKDVELPTELSNMDDNLNSLENDSLDEKIKIDDPINEDLGMFLIRKSDGRVDVIQERKCSSELEEADKHSPDDDDGNNTDELLRMLGDDGNKTKKLRALKTMNTKKQLLADQETTDEDDDFEGAKVTSTMTVAKNAAFLKQYPPKKVSPPAASDSDASDDESSTMKKMFRTRSGRKGNVASKSTTKPAAAAHAHPKSLLRNQPPLPTPATPATPAAPKPVIFTNIHRTGKAQTSSPAKPPVKTIPRPPPLVKSTPRPLHPSHPSPAPRRAQTPPAPQPDDDYEDIDELCDMYSEERLMRPERTDEEIPTDEDTDPSDASLYDEMPSSESDDIEEWFALDIRAERAGDYIPLLGHKAYDLLSEEKKRVTSKLSTLRENIAALADKSRDQYKQIEDARRSLAELEALLTHT